MAMWSSKLERDSAFTTHEARTVQYSTVQYNRWRNRLDIVSFNLYILYITRLVIHMARHARIRRTTYLPIREEINWSWLRRKAKTCFNERWVAE